MRVKRKESVRHHYRLPVDAIYHGELVRAGTELTLWPDEIERLETAKRISGPQQPNEDKQS